MSLNRHIAAAARLRTQLNEAVRESDSARKERNAARLVVSSQADRIHGLEQQVAYLADERDQADAAHRAALADLAEAHRQLEQRDALIGDAVHAVKTVRDQPDMDRCG